MLIPSTAQVIVSVIAGKKIDGFRVCTKTRVGGILMVVGGMNARIKVQKKKKDIFNYQQGLEAAMEDSGGVARMEGHHDQ